MPSSVREDVVDPPRLASPAPSETSTDSSRSGRDRRSHRILIVEDFKQTSNFLSNTLKYCKSALCVCAVSGEDALAVMRERGRFDLILTDVMMTGMGGIRFVRRVRSFERERNWTAQTIVALSADEANSDPALAAGASVFVCKYDSPMERIFSILDGLRAATPPDSP